LLLLIALSFLERDMLTERPAKSFLYYTIYAKNSKFVFNSWCFTVIPAQLFLSFAITPQKHKRVKFHK